MQCVYIEKTSFEIAKSYETVLNIYNVKPLASPVPPRAPFGIALLPLCSEFPTRNTGYLYINET